MKTDNHEVSLYRRRWLSNAMRILTVKLHVVIGVERMEQQISIAKDGPPMVFLLLPAGSAVIFQVFRPPRHVHGVWI